MKALSRSYLWWPGLDKELETYAQHCEACQTMRNTPAPAPLHPWLWPTKPWMHVHVDFAGPFQGKMYFIVVDAHSKWPEVIPMSGTTSNQTIAELRWLFAAHGLPQQLVSDNGPQFTSDEFATFCKMNGIKHICCLPYHTSSNGQAKRFVQTSFKRAMTVSDDGKQSLSQKLWSFLLRNRCTPHSTTNQAPCDLFVGRRLRTRLDLLRPAQEDRVLRKQAQQKLHHDQHSRVRDLEPGQEVMARNFRPGATWLPAVVQKKLGPLTYLVKQREGKYCKRHIDHLRPYHDTRKEEAQPLEYGTSYPPTSAASSTTVQAEGTALTSATTDHPPMDTESPEESVRRYPVRDRHAPERLM